jgi:L-lactate dehydrogenase complex protein LldE
LRSTGLECWKSALGRRPGAKAIAELEGYDYVVIPSGSCADQIRNVYPQLLADDPSGGLRAAALAGPFL